LLSDFLTRNGYAVLRYDKRGVGESEGDYIQSTTYDFVEDVLSALAYFESRPEINHNKIGLIGHSEGAMIAPMVAADNPAKISSIILMGGIGVTGAELLLVQAEKIARINGVPEDEIKAIVSKNNAYYSTVLEGGSDSVIIEKLKIVDPEINDGTLHMLLLPWFRAFLAIDPTTYLQRVSCPVLAITGELDSQCPPAENLSGIEKALKEGGNTNYEIKSLPGLNHLFQTAESGSPYEYDQLEEIISPGTLDLILEWLNSQN
jgi:pimeloyl-ACP methyl ester carboxylesterase